MSDATRDRIDGKMDDVTGRGKSALGNVTGDDKMKGEGEADQASGKVKEGLADAKDKVDDVVKKFTDR